MKRFTKLEWDEHNRWKNEESHHVFFWEIGEAFDNDYILIGTKKDEIEKRMGLLGVTDAGRFLFVVFQDKGKRLARPISARDMKNHERRLYEKNI